jgi:heme-degrading monooxygenase HmoA
MRDMPGIVLKGAALRRHWKELPGAVGMWLWSDFRGKRCGSVTVWRSERDLRGFVRWEIHAKIAKQYRNSGQMTSMSWVLPQLDRRAILSKAKLELADWKVQGSSK